MFLAISVNALSWRGSTLAHIVRAEPFCGAVDQMFTVTHFATTPPEFIKSQIQQMVLDYLTDISTVAIAPSNPLYNLYQYGVGYEVHLYLQAMSNNQNIPTELLVALDGEDPSIVVGFSLYLPMRGDPAACNMAYLAVLEGHRRQGIARAMLNKMLARYPHAELACVVAKVPYFEAMGFQVIGARGPQILMNTRDHSTHGLLAVVDTAPIYQSVEVRQIHAYLLKQHGEAAMLTAEKQRDEHLDYLILQAEELVAERLGYTAIPETDHKPRLH